MDSQFNTKNVVFYLQNMLWGYEEEGRYIALHMHAIDDIMVWRLHLLMDKKIEINDISVDLNVELA